MSTAADIALWIEMQRAAISRQRPARLNFV